MVKWGYRSSENVVEDENTPKEDVQVTFKEVLEWFSLN